MNFNYKSATQALVKIEKSFDVNSLCYNSLRIWPIIRLFLWQQMENPSQTIFSNCSDSNEIPLFRIHPDEKNILKKNINTTDLLFFSSINPPLEYLEKNDSGYSTPFTDSLFNILKNDYLCRKLELVSNLVESSQPRSIPTTFLQLIYDGSINDNVNRINGFTYFVKIVKQITGIEINEHCILKEIRNIVGMRDYFLQLLQLFKPKVVFLVCYYNNLPMSLIWACKILGIKSVEIQHGLWGDYHGCHTHWTSIPDNGYELLPDYFWSWGDRCSSQIIENSCRNICCHIPLSGGNPKLINWFKNENIGISLQEKNNIAHLTNGKKKVVLITMSPPTDPLMPTHLVDVMSKTDNNWIWLIRLHPYYRDTESQKSMNHFLIENGIKNFDILQTNMTSLYVLLSVCTNHICFGSSSYYEALAFNVPTTIVHPNGLIYYGDDYNAGLFDYADNTDSLLRSLESEAKIPDDIEKLITIKIKSSKIAVERIINNFIEEKKCNTFSSIKTSHLQKLFNKDVVSETSEINLTDTEKTNVEAYEIKKSDYSNIDHIGACVDWLIKSRNIIKDATTSAVYEILSGKWKGVNSETTANIIPTIISYAKISYKNNLINYAIDIGENEIITQNSNGGIGLNPNVFSTGQALFGFMALYKETGRIIFMDSAIKAANWLVNIQEPDGKWVQYTCDGSKLYHVRIAWALAEMFKLTREENYRIAVSKNITWVMNFIESSAWFNNINKNIKLNILEINSIAYTQVALVEICRLHNCQIDLDYILEKLKLSAYKIMEFYYKQKQNSNRRHIGIPGTFDSNWSNSVEWSPLIGNAQIAFFLIRLSVITSDLKLNVLAKELIDSLKSVHFMTESSDNNLRGGILGSYPINGKYYFHHIPSWGVKFFADALIVESKINIRTEFIG